MIWIVFITAFVICVTIVIIGMKGVPRTLESIYGPMNDLLKRGYDGGFLLINISNTKRFLQVRKYINAPGKYGIELAFPKAPWSIPYFDSVCALCDRNGQPYTIAQDKFNGPLSFLYADFGKDVEKAFFMIREILIKTMGVSENDKLFCD